MSPHQKINKTQREQAREVKRNYKTHRKQRTKQQYLNPSLSTTTLNINGLNFLIKIHRVAEWIEKEISNSTLRTHTH